MDPRRFLTRFLGSQWTRVFGPAILTLEVVTVAAAAYSGDWNLLLFFPILIVYFLFRALLFAGLVFFPVWITIIVVLAGVKLLFKKPEKLVDEESARDKQQANPA